MNVSAPGCAGRTRLYAGCVLALLAVLALAPVLRVHAQSAASLRIAAHYVESVPLATMGDPKDEEIFIYADVRYSGTDVLQLSPWNFRIQDANGVEHGPQSYDGAGPLKSEDLLGKAAHAAGWLLFTMPTKSARNLSLVYQQTVQTQSGETRTIPLAWT